MSYFQWTHGLSLSSYHYYMVVSGKRFYVTRRMYNSVGVGAEVTVVLETRWWAKLLFTASEPAIPSVSTGGPVRRIVRGASPAAYPISTLREEARRPLKEERARMQQEAEHGAHGQIAVLRSLGIDAQVIGTRVEISEGPIRSLSPIGCRVPDSRIGPEFPSVELRSRIGRRVSWHSDPSPMYQEELYEKESFEEELRFERRIASILDKDPAVASAIITAGVALGVYMYPDEEEWSLESSADDVLTKELWECYVAVAHCLMAIPLSTGEGA